MSTTTRILTLNVRGRTRTAEIDCRPFNRAFSCLVGPYSTTKLVEPWQGLLIVKPNWRERLNGLFVALFGAGLVFAGCIPWLGFAWRGKWGWQEVLWACFALIFGLVAVVLVLIGPILVLMGLLAVLDLRSYRFDVGSGTLSYGMPGRRRSRPLEQVLAVQIVRHGKTRHAHPSGGGIRVFRRGEEALERPTYARYQLNLVLDDPAQPRLSLSDHGDLNWTWEAATKLANSLGVPLVDCMPDVEPVVIEPGRRSPQLASATSDVVADSLSVEAAPLPVLGSSTRMATLAQPHPDVLLIKASAFCRLFLTPYVGVPLVISGSLCWNFGQIAQEIGRWGAVFVCLAPWALLPMVLAFWPPRFQFDRCQGLMTYGRPWSVQTRPLADILAVQVIFGGRHQSSDSGGYNTYQLNLVFKDPPRSRLNLSNHSDRQWTQEAGRRLAEFLKVPLLDQLSPED